MWTVLKFDRKNLNGLLKDLSKKLNTKPKIYQPKIRFNVLKENKILSKNETFLLNDYLLCYHDSFKNIKIIESLKYCKGLKYFLKGYINSQNEINDFIQKCENHNDKEGYLKQSFFDFSKDKKLKFISGPFTDMVFNILSEQNNKIKILINNSKVTLSNTKYLFKPV
tara:strand:+ start:171 stop:671 length:501 start_codon:yes stop_codon:yes gene_type:complete